MKPINLPAFPPLASMILAGCLLSFASASAQSSVITYQGRLEKNGEPMQGQVDVRLRVFSVLSAGIALYSTDVTVAVANGEFTTPLGPFAAGVMDGSDRWIEVSVDDPAVAGLSYVALSPRQQLTSAPYALHAARAESLSGSITASQISGGVPVSQLTGTLSPSVIGSGATTGTITFSPASGAPFVVTDTNSPVVGNLNADKLDGLHANQFIQTTGGTMSSGSLSFGPRNGEHIKLYQNGSDIYSVGIQSSTQYYRSSFNFAWFKGGVHNDATFNPGTGGTKLMTLNADAQLELNGDLSVVSASGIYGSNHQFGGYGGSFTSTLGTGVYASAGFGKALWAVCTDANSHAGFFEGKVEVTGTTILAGEVQVKGALGGYRMANRDNANTGWVVYSRNIAGASRLAFYGDGVGDRATLDTAGNFRVSGALSGNGADVSESFESSGTEELEPGTVVVIDPSHPGKLMGSRTAYDTRVAGIVSGAGGVKPGLLLKQDGVMEGDHQVALSGRVYVKADAGSGPITPGDLLTTSHTPGHAMKVSAGTDAHGAILGKAMTPLESGTGMVLVLVTLH